MRAQLVVKFKHGDIVDVLRSAYGAHDPAALHGSKLWAEGQSTARNVTYAARTPSGLTVMAWPSAGRAEVYVESSTGRLRSRSEEVWEAIRDNGKRSKPLRLKPKLHSLALLDPIPGDVMASASVGLGKIVRDQLFLPIVTGLVTAAVLVVALARQASEEFVYGSITALAVAILSVVRLLADLRNRKLVWR